MASYDGNDCFNNPDNDQDEYWDKLETISTFDDISEEDNSNNKNNNNPNNSTTLAVTNTGATSTTTTTTSGPYLKSSILNNKDILKKISRLLKPYQTTPISIIVQSLLLHVSAQYSSTYDQTHFYHALCERLHQMGVIDNSYLKTEFEDVRVQFQESLLHIIETVRENPLSSLPTIQNNSIVPIARNINPNNSTNYDYHRRSSKYYREFIEMDFIAGGGFGQVYKARNNLDGIVYAIKKIKINSTKSKAIMRCISEVKTLARVNHINIVPYKTAWIESFLHNPKNIISNNALPESNSSSSTSSESYSNTTEDQSSSDNENNSSDCRNLETNEMDDESDNDNDDISIQFVYHHSKSIDDKFSDDDLENDTNVIISNINDTQSSENELLSINQLNQLSVKSESSDSFIVFQNNSGNTVNGTHNDSEPPIEMNSTNQNSKGESKRAESKGGKKFKNTTTTSSKSRVTKKPTKKYEWATLYIQMSLCQLTLREWLRERNTYTHPKFIEFYQTKNVRFNEDHLYAITYDHYTIVNELFRQLLMGIKYIHKINVIHHDIKPQNIFIDIEQNNAGSLTIKLGDFGLACPLDKKHKNVGVGTLVYSAPEQRRNICSIKSDIYSLGVVLIELLIDCNTESELVHVLKDIKYKRYADLERIPEHYLNVIERLLQKDYEKRPDIHELIELLGEIRNVNWRNLSEENSVTIENVENKYASTGELDQEIEKLKQLLSAKEEERLRVIERENELMVLEKKYSNV